jgi:hypothetical protein
VSRIFSPSYPLDDKKKKTQGKKKENRKKRFRMRYRSALFSL